MCAQSGGKTSKSPLVSFLYFLLRDGCASGYIEDAPTHVNKSVEIQYSNGWLAEYAEYCAKRLMERCALTELKADKEG
jgi:hypothetical protein